MIITVFKKLDSEVVKSMIYDRDKDRMAKDGWLETHAEAELTKEKGAKNGDDSSATSKAVATGNTGSGVGVSARK